MQFHTDREAKSPVYDCPVPRSVRRYRRGKRTI